MACVNHWLKAFMLFLFLALVLGVRVSAHVDGAYLAKASYGSAGDPVIQEVLSQIEKYNAAKLRASAIQRGELEGNLREAQEACVELALYSYVQAMYLCEMGRLSALAGNKEQAKVDYLQALAAAERALTVDTHEKRTLENSRRFGKTFKVIATRALTKL